MTKEDMSESTDESFSSAVHNAVNEPGVTRMDVPESLRGAWEAAHLPSGVSIAFSSAIGRVRDLGLNPWPLITMSDRQLEELTQALTPDAPDS